MSGRRKGSRLLSTLDDAERSELLGALRRRHPAALAPGSVPAYAGQDAVGELAEEVQAALAEQDQPDRCRTCPSRQRPMMTGPFGADDPEMARFGGGVRLADLRGGPGRDHAARELTEQLAAVLWRAVPRSLVADGGFGAAVAFLTVLAGTGAGDEDRLELFQVALAEDGWQERGSGRPPSAPAVPLRPGHSGPPGPAVRPSRP